MTNDDAISRAEAEALVEKWIPMGLHNAPPEYQQAAKRKILEGIAALPSVPALASAEAAVASFAATDEPEPIAALRELFNMVNHALDARDALLISKTSATMLRAEAALAQPAPALASEGVRKAACEITQWLVEDDLIVAESEDETVEDLIDIITRHVSPTAEQKCEVCGIDLAKHVCEFAPAEQGEPTAEQMKDEGHHLSYWLWCDRCQAWVETNHNKHLDVK